MVLSVVASAASADCYVTRARDHICDGSTGAQEAQVSPVVRRDREPAVLEPAADAPSPSSVESSSRTVFYIQASPSPADPVPVFIGAIEQKPRDPVPRVPETPDEWEETLPVMEQPAPPPFIGPSCSGESLMATNFSDGSATGPNLKWSDKSDNGSVEGGRLKVTYDEGVTGTKGGVQWKSNIGAHEEAFASYTVCFPDDWDGVKGGKLPGLCGGDCPTGGDDADNGFSSRYMWRPEGELVLYLYHLNKPGKFGEDLSVGRVEPGECLELAQQVRLNDVGRKNGEITVWVNGEQTFSAQNMELRTSDWTIDTFYFSTFFGGSGPEWAPTKEETLYFDDIAVCKPDRLLAASGRPPVG